MRPTSAEFRTKQPKGGATLEANYQKMTGKTTAYQDLRVC